jgi:hypothetical protein
MFRDEGVGERLARVAGSSIWCALLPSFKRGFNAVGSNEMTALIEGMISTRLSIYTFLILLETLSHAGKSSNRYKEIY